jgi:hypothetical protein
MRDLMLLHSADAKLEEFQPKFVADHCLSETQMWWAQVTSQDRPGKYQDVDEFSAESD